jgi:hypothetical protein
MELPFVRSASRRQRDARSLGCIVIENAAQPVEPGGAPSEDAAI